MLASALLSLAIVAAPAVAGDPAASPTDPSRTSFRDRLFVGGGVGAAFGDIDYVELAPIVGYRVNPRVSVGGGLLYRFKSDDRYAGSEDTTDYGASLFTRVTLVPSVFAQAEVEHLDYEYALPAGGSVRSSSTSFLAGAGFFQPAGRSGGFYASALYNFSYDAHDPATPYDSPWVYRVGYTFGF